MSASITRRTLTAVMITAAVPSLLGAQAANAAADSAEVAKYARVYADDARLQKLKRDAMAEVEKMREFTQQMVDQIFSYGELGFQEQETAKYLTAILEREGFTVTRGVAGMPTAWLASWGSGKPVIALGSDVDGIPQSSQKPGVAYHDPIVPGAPGHGEGHNSGQAVNVTAAIAVKRIMERDRIPGTIKIWPGTAEELVGAKAYFVRDGMFKDVDAALFSHVSSDFRTSWGQPGGNGLVSVEFTFTGTSAHSAGAPWRGRSALDAVELMNVGWNFRREHLRIQHRSHYVIKNGGDQPNVVPTNASVWYYFRETEYPRIMELWKAGEEIAKGAAMMTGTTLSNMRVLGTAWPQHMNRPIAEQMMRNIQMVGMPKWDEKDQELARAVQREVGARAVTGLDTTVQKNPDGPIPPERQMGGGSDDIGDVSWNVPTITLRFPSNIPDLPGHNWANAISMATPIAHKGATAGAKAMAMTMLDLTLKPQLVTDAWGYFNNVQTKTTKYTPLIRPQDRPAIELNADIMAKYREEMRKYYYDPSRYKTYLEQLGVQYPTVKKPATTSQ
jgi:aminobenzoyl-glutamate utilization protein B